MKIHSAIVIDVYGHMDRQIYSEPNIHCEGILGMHIREK